jgi:hypothetical protein
MVAYGSGHLDGGLAAATLARDLRPHGVVLPEGSRDDVGFLTVNTTILRRSQDALLAAFAAAWARSGGGVVRGLPDSAVPLGESLGESAPRDPPATGLAGLA